MLDKLLSLIRKPAKRNLSKERKLLFKNVIFWKATKPNQTKHDNTHNINKKKQITKISNSFMTEIIFIVVKPKKKLKHTQNDPQSALIWRNALEKKNKWDCLVDT